MNYDEHCRNNHDGHHTWWLRDARGIECGKVCDMCEHVVRSRYRADIFTDPNYWADEPVEPDY